MSNSLRGLSTRSALRSSLGVESLEERATPTVSAFFNAGILTVVGDGAANDIVVAASDTGELRVTEAGSEVSIQTLLGSPTLDQVTSISVQGRGGNDALTIDGSIGNVSANLDGGNGNDTLTLLHRGNSVLQGGRGNDILISGFGNDIMLGGDGNDLLRWDPGTINDVMEGGRGNDTVQVIGNDTFQGAPAGDVFQLSANGDRVRFDRLNLVPFTLDIGTTENIILQPGAGDDTVIIQDLTGVTNLRKVVVEGGAGNDVIDASGQVLRRLQLTLDGGIGDDIIDGGAGNDILLGGDGNDVLRGNAGRDLVLGGSGDDTLDGGKGRDILVGGSGADSLNGGNDRARDLLVGGNGADTFVRDAANRDCALDLSGEDTLDNSGLI